MLHTIQNVATMPQQSAEDIFELLWHLGYFIGIEYPNKSDAEKLAAWHRVKAKGVNDPLMIAATRAYQKFNGLVVDGDFGPKTKASAPTRHCSVPDFQPLTLQAGSRRTWPEDRITYWVEQNDPLAPPNSVTNEAMRLVIKMWNEVCGTKLETWEEGEPGPNIYAYWQRIVEQGVLGWSQLGWPGMSQSEQLEQRYDTDWTWYVSVFAPTNNPEGINLAAMAGHEVGHALGWGHVSFSEGVALMNPSINKNVTKPTVIDIRRAIETFGPPHPVDEPDPPVDPTNVPRVRLIWGDESRWVGKLHKAKAGEEV